MKIACLCIVVIELLAFLRELLCYPANLAHLFINWTFDRRVELILKICEIWYAKCLLDSNYVSTSEQEFSEWMKSVMFLIKVISAKRLWLMVLLLLVMKSCLYKRCLNSVSFWNEGWWKMYIIA